VLSHYAARRHAIVVCHREHGAGLARTRQGLSTGTKETRTEEWQEGDKVRQVIVHVVFYLPKCSRLRGKWMLGGAATTAELQQVSSLEVPARSRERRGRDSRAGDGGGA